VVRIAAIISLFISVLFCAWSIKHGVWDYTLFALLGLFLWALSTAWDTRPWVRSS
jgi:hypothetical protein